MSIKQQGGVFGRNPTFNDVTIEGQLTFDGDIDINSDLKVSGAVEATTLYASNSIAVGNPANYQATFYMPGANANYVQVANGMTGAAAGNGILYGIDASGNGVLNKQGTGDLITTVAGIERLRILQAGTLDVSAANIAFDSGYGIDFSATAGTGTSELLDDYEKGAWTPTIVGYTTSGAFTYDVQEGTYTKVGDLVTVASAIHVTATAISPVGDVSIYGLPFTIGNQSPSFTIGWSQFITFADQLGAYGGGTAITLRNMLSGGSGALVSGADFGSSFYLFISGSYYV